MVQCHNRISLKKTMRSYNCINEETKDDIEDVNALIFKNQGTKINADDGMMNNITNKDSRVVKRAAQHNMHFDLVENVDRGGTRWVSHLSNTSVGVELIHGSVIENERKQHRRPPLNGLKSQKLIKPNRCRAGNDLLGIRAISIRCNDSYSVKVGVKTNFSQNFESWQGNSRSRRYQPISENGGRKHTSLSGYCLKQLRTKSILALDIDDEFSDDDDEFNYTFQSQDTNRVQSPHNGQIYEYTERQDLTADISSSGRDAGRTDDLIKWIRSDCDIVVGHESCETHRPLIDVTNSTNSDPHISDLANAPNGTGHKVGHDINCRCSKTKTNEYQNFSMKCPFYGR